MEHKPDFPNSWRLPGYEMCQRTDALLFKVKKRSYEKFLLSPFCIVVGAIIVANATSFQQFKLFTWDFWWFWAVFWSGVAGGAIFLGIWVAFIQETVIVKRNEMVIERKLFVPYRSWHITHAALELKINPGVDDGEVFSLQVIVHDQVCWRFVESADSFGYRRSPQDLLRFGLLLQEVTGWPYIVPECMKEWLAAS